jgi:hypothetical protein
MSLPQYHRPSFRTLNTKAKLQFCKS